jgi:hypothetical protein
MEAGRGKGPIEALDWSWLILAIMLAVSHLAASADSNRDRVPRDAPRLAHPVTP